MGPLDTDPAALVPADKPSLLVDTCLSLAGWQPPPSTRRSPPSRTSGCGVKPLVLEGPRGGSLPETRMFLCASLTF